MHLKTKLSLVLALCAGIGATDAVLAAACPGTLALPAQSPQNAVVFGDAVSYSLPTLGISVDSSPGQIEDCIVIATGAGGQNVTTNTAGFDNAYATPNGKNGTQYFRTGDPANSPDPGAVAAFAGQTQTTWDAQLSALSSYLNGNDMVVYFNHNQDNSGGTSTPHIDQDLFIWAQIALVDLQDASRTLYFYVTSVPNQNSAFLPNFGASLGDPSGYGNPYNYTGPQTPATCTYPTGTDSGCTFPIGGVGTGAGSGDASYMVRAKGQICLDGPVGSGNAVPCDGSGGAVVSVLNENLGANEVANAVVFPEINDILRAAGFNGYDVLQADIRMGCNPATITTAVPNPTGDICGIKPETSQTGSGLNNGYEQIFIAGLNPTVCTVDCTPGVPEPATLALVGAALLGGVMARRRRTI